MKIIELPIDQIKPYAKNPRRNDAAVDAVAASLKAFQWQQPIVVDAEHVIIAGHTRWKAAKKLGLKTVPVHVADLTPEQARAYRIADNSTRDRSEWDIDLLKLELPDLPEFDFAELGLDLAGLGLGEPDLPPADAEPQIDRADELQKKWQTATGQLWAIGEHRLLCGDSTVKADVERVMGGEKIEAAIYDPEWDAMPPAVTAPSVLAFCDGARFCDIIQRYGAPAWVFAWDCGACWYTPNRPLKRIKLCAWYGDITAYNFDGWHYGDSGHNRIVHNTRGEYLFKPDPKGLHLADLFCESLVRVHAESEHTHSKPLDWMSLLIGNCTTGTVYDPFLGSGTTMAACENLGRKCLGIEISEAYCGVILERMASAFPDLDIHRLKS